MGRQGHASRRQSRPANRAGLVGARKQAPGTPRSIRAAMFHGASRRRPTRSKSGSATTLSCRRCRSMQTRGARASMKRRPSRPSTIRSPKTSRRITARSRRAARTRSARPSVGAPRSCAPGLSSVRFDPTDRFAYWVARLRLPRSSSAQRPVPAVVPGRWIAPCNSSMRAISRRGCSTWSASKGEGTFDACSAGGQVDDGRVRRRPRGDSARGAGSPTVPQWIDDETLLRYGVTPWTGLPLWIPASDAGVGGLHAFPCARAMAHGSRLAAARERRSTTRRPGFASATIPTPGAMCCPRRREREILAASCSAGRVAACRARRAIIAAGVLPDRGSALRHGRLPTNAALLEFALRTAQAAGEAILPHFRAALDVEDKGGAARLRPGHGRRSCGRGDHPRGDRARLSRPRHSRRGARPERGPRTTRG